MIGIVNQNTFLFNDSIYNNIVIGRENITEQDVVDALKRADIYDFVQSLPGKIHTKADVIHVIHEGRVVEEGTHSQLMEYGGYYYRLFTTSNNMQTEGEINHGKEEEYML